MYKYTNLILYICVDSKINFNSSRKNKFISTKNFIFYFLFSLQQLVHKELFY